MLAHTIDMPMPTSPLVQEFYFAPRHASAAAGELECTRCCLHIARRQTYWVDRAAASWSQVSSSGIAICWWVMQTGVVVGRQQTCGVKRAAPDGAT